MRWMSFARRLIPVTTRNLFSLLRSGAPPPARSSTRLAHDGSSRLGGLALGAGTASTGLVAGMFFDWAIAIMPSLSRSDDRTFVLLMQRTNRMINRSPAFGTAFTGAFAFTGVAVVLHRGLETKAARRWMLTGLLLNLVVVGVTMRVNIPLNETIARAGRPDEIVDIAALRASTEARWSEAHMVRTIAAVMALISLCRALWLRRT